MTARGMLLAVAAACFAAGVATGWAWSTFAATGAATEDSSPDQIWFRTNMDRYRETFDLRGDQIDDLRSILLVHLQEKARILARASPEQWPPGLYSQLENSRRRMETRVQWILDDSQKKLFEQLSKQQVK